MTLLQAHPSRRLRDSDVFAITHAEAAAESTHTAENRKPQSVKSHSQLPALSQLQALADNDAITPQGKQLKGSSRATANSPHAVGRSPSQTSGSSRAVTSGPQGQGTASTSQAVPALSQLRALAGIHFRFLSSQFSKVELR